MKKTIIILIVIAALGALIYSRKDSTIQNTQDKQTDVTKAGHPDMSNGTYNIEHELVTLSSGTNSSPIAEGSALSVETDLTDVIGYGDISGDGKEDAVGILIQSGGGSGIFAYIAAYVSAPVAYKGTNAIFVGDRVSPQSISVSNGIITLKYLDRSPSEAMAEEPTVEMTKEFVYKSGELQER
jgi:hypothetical protein